MTPLSPGVYINERDFSDYIAGQATTIFALVGVAARGPLNKPTLLTSPDQFLSVFGEPSANSFGPHAAINFLRRGQKVWYCRVAKVYTEETALFDSMGEAEASGDIFSINVQTGHGLNVGDFVKITQTGRVTSQNLQITDITGLVITFASKLLDIYTDTSDVRIDSSDDSAAAPAEVFVMSRHHGQVTPLLSFRARYPGDFANFGSSQGIEVLIEDGGQFANLDAQGNVITSQGIPLQGVMPAAPSKDTKFDLLALNSTNGVRVGETRGVNFDSAAATITSVANSSGSLVLNVSNSSEFKVADTIEVSGTSVYDGNYSVTAIPNGTSIVVSGYAGTITPGTETGFVESTTGHRFGVVYRCTAVTTTSSAWSPVGVLTKRVRILFRGVQVEVFDNVIGYDPASPNFWDTVVGTEANPISQYVTATYLGANGEQPINSYDRVRHPNNPRFLMGAQTSIRTSDNAQASQQVFDNAKGYNGSNPSSAEYIGTISNSTYTGLQHFRRVDLYDINILAVPGVTLAAVLDEVTQILLKRYDCFGIYDTPFGLSLQQVIDWHNGTGEYTGLHTAFATNMAALYWPWVKVYDPYSKKNLWMPPTTFVPGVFAYNDSVGKVWTAPAGEQRGQVPNALAVEYATTEEDRNAMYGPGNGNALNAIASFNDTGVVVYGQRTLQRFASSLDRINVRRMMFDLIKVVRQASRRLNFEQNGPTMWEDWLNIVEPAFRTRKQQEAIEWFQLKCDADTNTPDVRNQNLAKAKVYVIPTKSAEAFEIDFTLLPSGADVEQFIARDVQGSTVQA